MTRQERDIFWIGLAVLCGAAFLAEFILAPSTLAKPIVMLGCMGVIGYAFYRPFRRKRRHSHR